ncbi:ribosome maturation factor RimP [uncultured Ruminococcus sp.]|uniref:ribosome maturation factor RimP n=1 Tax=uncultured Ruminococcus sp. TaxID=165186 RepID=UPI0025ECBE5D|nr:ribosome maturation factor RimP [uncultured Ruminococcus sp.]
MAKSKGGVTVSKVWELCEPIVKDFGLSLWDVRYEKEGADWYLRIFIDKEGGVDITDCEKVSRAINTPLDELDPIENAYCLEVCSPGVERELVRDEHFTQFIGADIMVKMRRPIEGIGKDFCGVLKGYDDGMVTIADHSGENEVTINKKDAAWIKLDDFD